MTPAQSNILHERDAVLIRLFGLEWFCKMRKIKPNTQLKLEIK